jgi:hypothetical protein
MPSAANRIVKQSALAAAALLMVLAVCPARPAASDENLLHNGDLAAGSGNLPDDWRPTSMRATAGISVFSWQRPSADPGELRVTSTRTNVADWGQTLALAPGWYYLSGEIRSLGIADGTAMIAIEVHAHLFGLSGRAAGRPEDWRTGDLYFKVGGSGRNVQVVCQLEGTGTAFFRRVRLVRVPDVPPLASRFDLDSVPEHHPTEHTPSPTSRPFAPPTGRTWTIVATILLLAGITIWGWTELRPDPGQARRDDQQS